MVISGQDQVVEQQFTAKERDAESGLDYFGARFFMAPAGRFLSADKPFADQFVENPQSWNLYAYTRNNPLKYVDNNGEFLETAWDVANIAIGVISFVSNVRQGDYGAAAIDAVSVVADSVAAAVPVLPGGAGTVIRGARIADKVGDTVGGVADAAAAVGKADKAADVGRAASGGVDFRVTPDGQGIPIGQSRTRRALMKRASLSQTPGHPASSTLCLMGQPYERCFPTDHTRGKRFLRTSTAMRLTRQQESPLSLRREPPILNSTFGNDRIWIKSRE